MFCYRDAPCMFLVGYFLKYSIWLIPHEKTLHLETFSQYCTGWISDGGWLVLYIMQSTEVCDSILLLWNTWKITIQWSHVCIFPEQTSWEAQAVFFIPPSIEWLTDHCLPSLLLQNCMQESKSRPGKTCLEEVSCHNSILPWPLYCSKAWWNICWMFYTWRIICSLIHPCFVSVYIFHAWRRSYPCW